MMARLVMMIIGLLALPFMAQGSALPQLDDAKAGAKLQEIMQVHATHKQMTPELARRALSLYIEELDPSKTYFIRGDIEPWLEPSDALLQQIIEEYRSGSFDAFMQLHDKMGEAVLRRRALEQQIHFDELPKNVKAEEFKDIDWAGSLDELQARITRMRALQFETAAKLIGEDKEHTLQRIVKSQSKAEEDYVTSDEDRRHRHMLTKLLKASTAALDTHTAYFTPEEAREFLINVQQRLFGIGAQLRDDLNGFTVVRVVEGGPAALGKELKAKDRIIAVDGQPVVGMDIVDAVQLIRGAKDTKVLLTVVRESGEGEGKKEEKLNIAIVRGEVVLKETRYESSFEPFADGGIAYLRLFSFYQDPEFSSATDLVNELEKLQKDHKIYGVVLDLRSNSGGLLTQAVAVAGLFITKGIVVSIKDENGVVQHLRDIDGEMAWDGPLIVLINRASASASEIVAQALQDYGRAIIVGDDHSYGKGSFQTFTLNASDNAAVNPEGEYKVTRGRYYTVSGKTPQLNGVAADIVVPGSLSEMELGERYVKFPLDNDSIKENFDDDLSDIPLLQRPRVRLLYKFDLQPKVELDNALLAKLRSNSQWRIEHNKNYQAFLKEVKKRAKEQSEEELESDKEENSWGQTDLQLSETINIMKDYVALDGLLCPLKPAAAASAN